MHHTQCIQTAAVDCLDRGGRNVVVGSRGSDRTGRVESGTAHKRRVASRETAEHKERSLPTVHVSNDHVPAILQVHRGQIVYRFAVAVNIRQVITVEFVGVLGTTELEPRRIS